MQRGLHALRRAVVAEVEDVNRLIYHVLRTGIVIAVGLVGLAFLLAFAEGAPLPDQYIPLREIPGEIAGVNPAAFLTLGILVLVLTPVARVLASLLSFVEERDRRFVLVAGIVLLNLLISLLVGLA